MLPSVGPSINDVTHLWGKGEGGVKSIKKWVTWRHLWTAPVPRQFIFYALYIFWYRIYFQPLNYFLLQKYPPSSKNWSVLLRSHIHRIHSIVLRYSSNGNTYKKRGGASSIVLWCYCSVAPPKNKFSVAFGYHDESEFTNSVFLRINWCLSFVYVCIIFQRNEIAKSLWWWFE